LKMAGNELQPFINELSSIEFHNSSYPFWYTNFLPNNHARRNTYTELAALNSTRIEYGIFLKRNPLNKESQQTRGGLNIDTNAEF